MDDPNPPEGPLRMALELAIISAIALFVIGAAVLAIKELMS